MSIPVVAFDEAGNTGPNLLDSVQPCFALASVHLSDEDATTVLQPVLGSQAEEAHFADLKRRPAGRQAILEVLRSPLLTAERAKIYVVHKPYMVITKLVDLLIEELAYRQGIDLYDNGHNIALANLLYYCVPAFCGGAPFHRLQESFVDMVRTKSESAISNFFDAVNDAIRKCKHSTLRAHLHRIRRTRVVVQDHIANWWHTELDPAVPCFLHLSVLWSDQFGEAFSVVHDHSKPIAFEKDFVEALMDPNGPHIRIGRDRRVSPLFIKATGVSLFDSRVSKQIQVADILAGVASHLGNRRAHGKADDDFLQPIRSAFRREFLSGGLWASTEVTASKLGTDGTFKGENEDRVGTEILKRIYIDSQGRPRRRS